MATQARGMGAARLSERLEVSNPRDELGTLALSFNELLDSPGKIFRASRPLRSRRLPRTPHSGFAILQGETEVTLSRPDRPPEEYRETLAILRDESHRLAHIIEDLFTLTRADAGQYPLKPRDLYLDEWPPTSSAARAHSPSPKASRSPPQSSRSFPFTPTKIYSAACS